MYRETSYFDDGYFLKLVESVCGTEVFLERVHMTKKRLFRLLAGESEFTQSEMRCSAAALKLDDREFERCFFRHDGSENLNR